MVDDRHIGLRVFHILGTQLSETTRNLFFGQRGKRNKARLFERRSRVVNTRVVDKFGRFLARDPLPFRSHVIRGLLMSVEFREADRHDGGVMVLWADFDDGCPATFG